jgi:hypothetical protein
MKYYTFFRENNKFDDITKDPNLSKSIDTKIHWFQHLMIGVNDSNEGTISYLTLKYGDDMVQDLYKNFAPVAGVDYKPEKDKNLFTKATS